MGCTHRLVLPVLLLVAVPVLGQDVRDSRPGPPPPPPVGTSRISGQVIAADTGTPVKRAAVTIIGRAMPQLSRGVPPAPGGSVQFGVVGGVVSGGSGLFPPQVTDDAGRFEFPDLPAGLYTIVVSPRSGFVRPQRPQQVDVGEGKQATVSIRLERTGVITGRLLDESGEPLARGRVTAYRRAGGRLMQTGMGDMTDDLGQFRLFDLPPGEYLVSGSDSNIGPMNPNAPGPSQGFAPTYFPGSASVDGARSVAVKSAQETAGVEFSLVRVLMGRVTGTVRDSNGQVATARASVNISRRGDEAGTFSRGSSVRPDGTFLIAEVPPGDYYVVASVSSGEGANASREGAYVPVSVNGNEASVDIRTNTGATIRGRVLVEGTPPELPPGLAGEIRPEATRITIQARPMPMSGGGVAMVSNYSRPANPAEDGTFELTGVRGPTLLTASGFRLALKSIMRGATDVTARPMEFRGTERISDVTIVLTYDTGTIHGMVTGDQGEPLPGVWVVVYPEDENRWFLGSPFVHVTRSMQAMPSTVRPPQTATTPGSMRSVRQPPPPGTFMTPSLMPGRYLVVAVEGDMMPPTETELLDRLRKHAIVATVTAGAQAQVQVRAIKSF